MSIYIEKRDCKNCNTKNHCGIPKGTTIKDYMKEKKCSNCGCLLEGKK